MVQPSTRTRGKSTNTRKKQNEKRLISERRTMTQNTRKAKRIQQQMNSNRYINHHRQPKVNNTMRLLRKTNNIFFYRKPNKSKRLNPYTWFGR